MDHSNFEPIHITVPGSPDDPRTRVEAPPGVVVHYSPPLHPDDVTVVDGIPVTSVARTLVDCAEVMDKDELRELFASARAKGMLDIEAVRRSAARVEWRPSLPMLYEVIEEFDG
jgi:predicted transcriptional regulator of viral defense system